MEVHTQRSTVARFPELTHRARIPLKLTKMFPNKGMNEAYNAYNKHRLYIHRLLNYTLLSYLQIRVHEKLCRVMSTLFGRDQIFSLCFTFSYGQ